MTPAQMAHAPTIIYDCRGARYLWVARAADWAAMCVSLELIESPLQARPVAIDCSTWKAYMPHVC